MLSPSDSTRFSNPGCPLRIELLLTLALATAATGQWSVPIPDPNVNTASSEFDPSPTSDGLTLYLSSRQTGNFEIFRATRPARYAPFGLATQVTELADAATDAGPCARFDDLEIIFYSNRAGGAGSGDLWRATRTSTAVPFGAPTPISELNSGSGESAGSLTGDGLTIYFQRAAEIYTASRPTLASPFGAPVLVPELNTVNTEREPHVSPDGLSIFFSSDRAGGVGGLDTWHASRLSRTQPFGNIQNLTALNSTSGDVAPAVAWFSDEVFFTSTRPGGQGSYDIHVARFTGLVADGRAGLTSTQFLRFSDPASAGKTYFAGSALGSSPGIPIDTRVVPLNPDSLFFLTFGGGLPPILNGYAGILDGDGVAAGSISFAGLPFLLGFQFVSAFVVMDPPAPSRIRTISNAHEVLVH